MANLAPIVLKPRKQQPINTVTTEDPRPTSKASSKKSSQRRSRPRSSNKKPPPKSREMSINKPKHHPKPRKDFILRAAPLHYNHWTSDHLKDILRTKIEGRSKRRCNRNQNALKFLGGTSKNGINARQLRRRCLRMALPLTRIQSDQLFRDISGGSDASMSVHQFLLGLFPHDYEASLTNDLHKQQTLMGLSEIDRAGLLNIDWNKKKAINPGTLRWTPEGILLKLQQAFVKRGGGVQQALKRYQTMRKDDPAKSERKTTHLGKNEMRMVINTIFRIPANQIECDRFFDIMANGRKTIPFVPMFRKLTIGLVMRDNKFVEANRGHSVSDKIGKFDPPGGEGGLKVNNNKDIDNFDDTASWVSLASTRAPSVKALNRPTPRPSSVGSNQSRLDRLLAQPFTGRSLSSALTTVRSSALPSARSNSSSRSGRNSARSSGGRNVPRPQSAASGRSVRSRSSSKSRRSGVSGVRPQSATSRNASSLVGVMSMAINTAAHYRRLRTLAVTKKQANRVLYQPMRATSARQLY